MPNIKSAKKRVETSRKRAARNASARSTLKTAIKRFSESVDTQNTETLNADFKKATSLLDRAAKNKLIHRNTIARKKSKLAKQYNACKAQNAEVLLEKSAEA